MGRRLKTCPPLSRMIDIVNLTILAVLCTIPLAAQQYLSSDVELGSRLYRANCLVCHGPEGASIPGVDFRRGQFKPVASDPALLRGSANGLPGTARPPPP